MLSSDDLSESINKIQQPRNIPICRYGSGCTHLLDPTHREKFRHPNVPKLNDEQLQSQFICNECGYATKSIPDLQLHLKRKTAWSNKSLVGCRINCLVDYKEWYEGYVLQYHKSGKHFVEFRIVNEKRWLLMKKVYFYIIERPTISVIESSNCSEFKESTTENEGLAPIEDCWVYEEDISIDFAFAQSVLFKIYGNILQETGHLTMGHICLTKNDKNNAISQRGSLLYGELLPRGVNKALSMDRLYASKASTLFDLGMGTGKILIQAFLQFKNLTYVHGVELSEARYKIAEEALLKMVHLLGINSYQVHICPGQYIIVKEVIISNISTSETNHRLSKIKAKKESFKDSINKENLEHQSPCNDVNIDINHHEETNKDDNNNSNDDNTNTNNDNNNDEVDDEYEEAEFIERVIHLKCGNMFDIDNIVSADIVMMETDVPIEQYDNLKTLLLQMNEDAGLLTYLDLRKVFDLKSKLLPFRQLEENKNQTDRYPTSWSVQRGHHFYLWKSITKSTYEIENEFIRNKSKSNKNSSNVSNIELNHEEIIPITNNSSSPLRIMLGTLSSNHSSPMINICSPEDSYHIASCSSSFRSPIISINQVGNHATIASNSLVPNIESPILLLRNSCNIHDNINDDFPYQTQYQYQQQLFSQNNHNNDQLHTSQKQNLNNENNNTNLLDHISHYQDSDKEYDSTQLDYDSNQCLPCSFFSFLFQRKQKKSRNFETNIHILKTNIIENNHYIITEIRKSTNLTTDNIQENNRTTVIPLNIKHVPSLKTNLIINT